MESKENFYAYAIACDLHFMPTPGGVYEPDHGITPLRVFIFAHKGDKTNILIKFNPEELIAGFLA